MKTSLKAGKNTEANENVATGKHRVDHRVLLSSTLSFPGDLFLPCYSCRPVSQCLHVHATCPSPPAPFLNSSDIYKSDSGNGSGAAGFCKQTVDGLVGEVPRHAEIRLFEKAYSPLNHLFRCYLGPAPQTGRGILVWCSVNHCEQFKLVPDTLRPRFI